MVFRSAARWVTGGCRNFGAEGVAAGKAAAKAELRRRFDLSTEVQARRVFRIF